MISEGNQQNKGQSQFYLDSLYLVLLGTVLNTASLLFCWVTIAALLDIRCSVYGFMVIGDFECLETL